jgi:hypothetical protein
MIKTIQFVFVQLLIWAFVLFVLYELAQVLFLFGMAAWFLPGAIVQELPRCALVVHPWETISAFLWETAGWILARILRLFYALSVLIVIGTGFFLFNKERRQTLGALRKIFCGLAFVAAVLCVSYSFWHQPTNGYYDYSVTGGAEWVEEP